MMRVSGILRALPAWVARRPFSYWFRGLVFAAAAFTGLVFSANWKMAFALVLALTLTAFNLFSLQLGILPVFFAIPFDRLGKLGPESAMTVAKVTITWLIVAWAVRVLVGKDPRFLHVLFHSPLFLLATLLQAFSFISIMNAREYELFMFQNLRRVNNYVLFILVATIVDTPQLMRRAFQVFLFAYFFVGLTVMYEIATQQSILKTVWGMTDVGIEYTLTSGEFRVGGPGGDPDFLAVSVIFPTLVGLSLLLEPISRLAKWLILVVLLLLLASMLATGSRGGLLALGTGAVVFWLFSRMRYKYLIGAGAVVLVVGLMILLAVAGTASVERYTGEAGGKSVMYRMGWTEMAFQMIQDHPWLGVGTGHFPGLYNRYSRTIPQIPRNPHWTHNSYLQTWAENGVLAFLAYAALYLVAAVAMLKVIWRTEDPALRRLAVLMLSAVCGYFLFAGTSNVLENENYWMVFAMVTVISTLAREHAAGHPEDRVRARA
jgi:oligosaccharide repeat unit polymerase